MKHGVTSCLLLLATAAPALAANTPAPAAAAPAPQIVLGQDQQFMLLAAQKVMARDYPAALALYNQAVALNGGNIQAYIQRSVVKREMQDARGSEVDAAAALEQCNSQLKASPDDAMLYYQRGTAYRLLKDFPKARADIKHAMELGGTAHPDWKNDLQAIDLEEKIAQ